MERSGLLRIPLHPTLTVGKRFENVVYAAGSTSRRPDFGASSANASLAQRSLVVHFATRINATCPEPLEGSSHSGQRDDPAAHDEYMAAEQLTEETLSLLDRCVGVAFQAECSLRERGWEDAEATMIAAKLRTALLMNVAPTILRLESQRTHRSVEENS